MPRRRSLLAHPYDGVVVAMIKYSQIVGCTPLENLFTYQVALHDTKGLCHLLSTICHVGRRIGKGLEVSFNSCYLELIIAEERVCLMSSRPV